MPKLQCVGQQVLENLEQLDRVGPHDRQRIGRHLGAVLFDRQAQVVDRLVQHLAGVGGRSGPNLRTDPRVGQQTADQKVHPLGPLHGEVDVLAGLVVELIAIALLKHLHVRGHRTQRLLEIVRRRVGETLQVLVRPPQFAVSLLQLSRSLRHATLKLFMRPLKSLFRLPVVCDVLAETHQAFDVPPFVQDRIAPHPPDSPVGRLHLLLLIPPGFDRSDHRARRTGCSPAMPDVVAPTPDYLRNRNARRLGRRPVHPQDTQIAVVIGEKLSGCIQDQGFDPLRSRQRLLGFLQVRDIGRNA